MKNLIIPIGILLSAVFAQAYTLNCMSADKKIQYQLDKSDGGAPRDPEELLRVNGKDIINATVPGGPTFRIGSMALSERENISPLAISGEHKTSYFKALAKISNSSGTLILAEQVRCTEVVYIGAPRP